MGIDAEENKSESNTAFSMTPSQAASMARRGQGPQGIHRIDPPRIAHEQWHAHLEKRAGTPTINIDGTWKHGPGTLTEDHADSLREVGWNL